MSSNVRQTALSLFSWSAHSPGRGTPQRVGVVTYTMVWCRTSDPEAELCCTCGVAAQWQRLAWSAPRLVVTQSKPRSSANGFLQLLNPIDSLQKK